VQILQGARKLTHTPRILPWANEIKLLRENIQSKERIDKALEFLKGQVKRVGNDHRFPPVYGAAAFRRHFIWVEEAMAKWEKDNPTITLSDEAKDIAQWVSRLHWPKGASAQLGVVAQRSLDGLEEFTAAVIAFGESAQAKIDRARRKGLPISSKDTRRVNLANRVLDLIPNQVTFVKRWLEEVYKSVRKWKEWSGDLKYFILSKDHKTFQKKLRSMLPGYGEVDELFG
jgi:hypothetical protein